MTEIMFFASVILNIWINVSNIFVEMLILLKSIIHLFNLNQFKSSFCGEAQSHSTLSRDTEIFLFYVDIVEEFLIFFF